MVLEALTILLAVFLILIILRGTTRLSDSFDKYRNLPLSMTIFIALWLIYLSVLSYTEFLVDFTFPPRMPLMVVMPLIVLIIIILFRKATSDFVTTTSVSWLIYIQSFRIIVEIIIWGAYNQGLIPIQTTFEGSNVDVIVGLTAVPLAYYAKRDKISPMALIIWNIAGLLILANTVRLFISAGYFPELLGQDSSMLGTDFVKLPFLLIAGMFMPLAVLIHALSIKQLLKRR
jgi:hypothetical protein